MHKGVKRRIEREGEEENGVEWRKMAVGVDEGGL